MIGCLCIHGFTGSPYEVEPLVQYLRKHTNWKLVVPVLPGHGEKLDLKGVHYKEWIKHAETELKNLLEECEEVYVIGFSMGGLIACYLAAHYPITRLVLLSAAAYYMNLKQLGLDVNEMIKHAFRGELSQNELFIRYKRKMIATPISATFQFRQLVKEVRAILSEINVPTLIVQGQRDGIVPPKSAKFLYKKINSTQKKLLFFQDSKHMICHCVGNQALFKEIHHFLKFKKV